MKKQRILNFAAIFFLITSTFLTFILANNPVEVYAAQCSTATQTDCAIDNEFYRCWDGTVVRGAGGGACTVPAKCFTYGTLIESNCLPSFAGTESSRSYQDLSGGNISGPVLGKCYLQQQSNEVRYIVYREVNCAGVRAWAAAVREQEREQQGRTPVGDIPQPTGPEMDCKVDGDGNLDGGCALIDTLNVILNIVAGGVVLAVIINIIYGGIRYSMSQGNPSDASTAKKRITDAIMAFIMFMLLYVFLQWLIPGGPF